MWKATFVAALSAALLSTPAQAQQGQTAAAAPAQNEAARLQQRIGELQRQAMLDPSLQAAEDSFNAVLQGAMARLDPAAPARTARAAAVNQEVEAARAAGDNVKLDQLAQEAAALTAYFDRLRPRALAQPDVRTARQVFLARVFERMKQIDPDVQQYVDRFAELRRGSRTADGGGGR
jgi:hypothetical protein